MNLINKIVGKAVGECIDDGHDMKFENWFFSYRSCENRIVYRIHFKCTRCGYTVKKYSTKAQGEAIKVINDEYKQAQTTH
jgi:hypothetical protein